MKKNNPYSLTFGKEPLQSVARISQKNEICEGFLNEIAPQMIYMITGVRGSGKTVFMSELGNYFREQKDWIVVELNPEADLLYGLAAKLCEMQKLKNGDSSFQAVPVILFV